MKKQNAKKLDLNRETLIPLQADALDGVAGGVVVTPATIGIEIISRLVCPPPPGGK